MDAKIKVGRIFNYSKIHLAKIKKIDRDRWVKAAAAALAQLAIAAGLYAAPIIGDKSLPEVGYWSVKNGVVSEFASSKMTK